MLPFKRLAFFSKGDTTNLLHKTYITIGARVNIFKVPRLLIIKEKIRIPIGNPKSQN
jgi:hypothetical protein